MNEQDQVMLLNQRIADLTLQLHDSQARERAAQKGARINSHVNTSLARSNAELRAELGHLEWAQSIITKTLVSRIDNLLKCCDFTADGKPVVRPSTLYLFRGKDCAGDPMKLPVPDAVHFCWFNSVEDNLAYVNDLKQKAGSTVNDQHED